MVEFNDRRDDPDQQAEKKEPKFIVKAGDDDQHASRHTDIDSAEGAAAERSQQTFHRRAYVHRLGGRRIRSFHDGEMSGYLDGTTDEWRDLE